VLPGRGGRQEHGLAVEVGDGGAGGLLGQAAGLEADGAGAEAAVVDDGLGELDLGSLHGMPSLVEDPGFARRSSTVVRGRRRAGPRATTADQTPVPGGTGLVLVVLVVQVVLVVLTRRAPRGRLTPDQRRRPSRSMRLR
jgi:hypothetical protein